MGAEATCTVTFRGQSPSGKARLETDVLSFRGGDLKLSIPFTDIDEVSSCKGVLSVTFGGKTARFDLGAASTKWADKIKNPPSRLQKIGVKTELAISRMRTGMPVRFEPADAGVRIEGVLVECDADGRALSCEAVRVPVP